MFSLGNKPKLRVILVLAALGAMLSTYYLYHFVDVRYGFSPTPSFCSLSNLIDCDALQFTAEAERLGLPIGAFSLFFFLVGLQAAILILRQPSLSLFWFLRIWSLAGLAEGVWRGYALVQYSKLCLTCLLGQLLLVAFFGLVWLLKPIRIPMENNITHIKRLSVTALIAVFSFWIMPNLMLGTPHRKLTGDIDKWITQTLKKKTDTLPSGWIHPQYPDGDYAIGNPTGRIHIVSFHDFECPFCREMSKVFHRILMRFPQDVYLTIKNHPMDHHCHPDIRQIMHVHACQFAQMARCAGRIHPDLFWKAYQFINETPISDISTKSFLSHLHQVPEDRFIQCMQTDAEMMRIQTDIHQSTALSVSYSPTFFVNGYRIERYLPFIALERLILRLLNNVPSTP